MGRWIAAGALARSAAFALLALSGLLGLPAAAEAGTSPAAAAKSRPPKRLFGVNYNFYDTLAPSTARTMARGGVGSAIFGIDWSQVEASRGTYDWGASDAVIGSLAAAGVQPDPVLYGTPTWAASDQNVPPPYVNHEPPTGSSQSESGWVAFVSAAVSRYGPGGSYWSGPYRSAHPGARPDPVHVWQVWNEPNLYAYYWPQPSASDYATLLRMSSDAIRAADPRARVALGGLPCRVDYSCTAYLRDLYAQPGVKADFDLVGLHPYGPSVGYAITEIRQARRVMREEHDRRTPIWVSELGWGSGPRSIRLNEGPAGQARMLRKALTRIANQRSALGVWRLDWFDWRDPQAPEGPCGWCLSAGLFTAAGEPKPSWRAYQRTVRTLRATTSARAQRRRAASAASTWRAANSIPSSFGCAG